jgi:Cytochrome P460
VDVAREAFAMRNELFSALVISGTALIVLFGVTGLPQQDRYSLTVPDGLAFSEFRGYDAWETIAVSETEGSVKTILGNPTMIAAYKDGVPGNGKLFPEGSKTAKIEWIKKKNPESPYFVEVPDILKSLSFIEKDSQRFPSTHGWAYAQFDYDAGSKTFKPSVTGTQCGYTCHSRVASSDYIFTAYPLR